MSGPEFVVTHVEHVDCAECAEQAQHAETMARVTGSVGATHERSGEGLVTHGATVRRPAAVEAKEEGS